MNQGFLGLRQPRVQGAHPRAHAVHALDTFAVRREAGVHRVLVLAEFEDVAEQCLPASRCTRKSSGAASTICEIIPCSMIA